MRKLLKAASLALPLTLFSFDTAHAIRPLVTDDARVVGEGLAQLESWLDANREGISHNVLAAYGPTEWLELTSGFVHGGNYSAVDAGYGINGPLFQLKALAFEPLPDGAPGLAWVAGFIPPWGYGSLKPEGSTAFGFLAATESLFDDKLQLHANLGVAAAQTDQLWKTATTGGFGMQSHIVAGLHGVAEIYYGDPYAPLHAKWQSQIGFRYVISDTLQFDGTIGKNVKDDRDRWWTLGIRLVTPD
ncbi:hypothetical protein NP590_05235 [Methylomonas sp. SURF-2]|uniref:Transporter n=1 Tax=Methylomonas subterranea TaxID=2952225 RepID=A0ABT1TEJ3_9GAMM|nr:hypothetical protein [Methylomonas sp. SURF-2]MCQ8103502.1 hypothetical protein [Methylomonas sp. SURF-2]